MTLRRVVGTVAGCIMLFGPLSGVGAAAGAPPVRPSPVGASVDLSQGWGKYGACLVKPDGRVECFADAKALKARSDQLSINPSNMATARTVSGPRASTWCPVFLYSGPNYTGQVLELTSRWFWMNLSDFGFANRTVSFIGYSCGFYLAEYQWGGGGWFPGYTGPWAYAANMGPWGWNYRASSVYIQ